MNQKYVSRLFLPLVLGSVVLFAEPSVYGSMQGFTSTEKMIVKNRKTIASLQRKLAQQKERIDGLTSIVEGLNASIAELKEGRVSTSEGGGENRALLKELGEMIDKINDNYVSKAELQKALKGKYVPSSKSSKPKAEPKESLEGKSVSKLYSEGVRLFVKKRYDEAKKRFTITDTKGYKPAASNYYLGEIAYYTKKYEDAIFYFKKSAGLYDQATYIDTLLLHTAVSLEKSGDKAQAKAFYENIIANYDGKKSAKIAKQKLKKL
ncbi:TPR repeat containing exported protein; Putative periplasmic protein contains a protein prenylyltransferase domain [hydrothermal vent metagenome]|uniref:TPR repeat containing exported protein Putative periplasmic protein contains a protein prenylyltransferase domain n=1 Tax=hydrothermal vent metagenome TaxID=652676 RepID=A0A1W1BSJ5_9ZZZZ